MQETIYGLLHADFLRPLVVIRPGTVGRLADVLQAGGLNLEEPLDFCYQSVLGERFLQQRRR